LALAAALYHSLNHALFKGLLFLGAGLSVVYFPEHDAIWRISNHRIDRAQGRQNFSAIPEVQSGLADGFFTSHIPYLGG